MVGALPPAWFALLVDEVVDAAGVLYAEQADKIIDMIKSIPNKETGFLIIDKREAC
jgi:hypothetical protein